MKKMMADTKDDSLKNFFDKMDNLVKALDALILLKKDELRQISMNENKMIGKSYSMINQSVD